MSETISPELLGCASGVTLTLSNLLNTFKTAVPHCLLNGPSNAIDTKTYYMIRRLILYDN